MGKKKEQRLFKKLKFDETMEMYRCEHPVAGKPIEIFIMFVGCEADQLEMLADSTETLLGEWRTLQQPILRAAREELVACRRLDPGDKSKVTLASLIPFSITVTQEPDLDATFSLGLYLAGVLGEHEYFEYADDFARTGAAVEICYSE